MNIHRACYFFIINIAKQAAVYERTRYNHKRIIVAYVDKSYVHKERTLIMCAKF